MLKRFNMLALIVLLICHTILIPSATNAEGIAEPELAEGEEIHAIEENPVEDLDPEIDENEDVSEDQQDPTTEQISENELLDSEEAIEEQVETDVDDKTEGAVQEEDTKKLVDDPLKKKDESNEVVVPITEKLASPINDAVISNNIITNVVLTLADKSELPNPMPNPSDEVLDLAIKYEFELPNNHGYTAGSTYTFNLPSIFKLHNKVEGKLMSAAGVEFGEFELATDGTVLMTFNIEIEKNSDIKGYLSFWTEIREDLVGGTEQTITFPIKDGSSIEMRLRFAPKTASSIDKRGIPNKSYNGEKITWEVDFNKQLSEIKNAMLRDPLGENQRFVAGSIKVYQLDVQLDGSIIKGQEITGHSYGDVFPLSFGEINSAYRVVFETEITDDTRVKYDNTATLTGDNITDLSATASVSIGRGEALNKKSGDYDPTTQEITWEVKYNYNQKVIKQDKAFLLDTLGVGHEFVDGSIRVLEMRIDPNTGKEVGSGQEFHDFTISNETNGFKLQFAEEVTKAYKITYQTKVTDRIIEDTNFTNIIKEGSNEEGETEAGKWVGQQIFHKNHYDKHTDYDAKTTKWGIFINGDHEVMHNVLLTDSLPKGLTLDDYTITHGGEVLVDKVDYTFDYDQASGKIEFKFINRLNPVTKEIEIEYTTSFEFNKIEAGKTSFTNGAKLIWTPDGETESRELERSATFKPNGYTQFNGAKGGSYNAKTKEIAWEIGVNYNKNPIENAIVEDIILGKQNFNTDSIKVYKMKIQKTGNWIKDGEALKVDQDYEVESIGEQDGGPGFRIKLGTIDQAYVIVYKTDLKDQLIVKEYKNTAILKDGETELIELKARVSVGANGGKYTGKEAIQNVDHPRVLNWRVSINPTQSSISNVILTDKPSSNQTILKDTFQLFGTNVAKNGDVTKDPNNKLVEDVDYTVTIKEDEAENEYFELAFKNKIEHAYILEYDTFIMAGNNQVVSNNASLTGDQITTEQTETEFTHIVRLTDGDGGMDGRVGKIQVRKIDATTNRVLEGAEFTLFDNTGTIAIRTLTTDENGVAAFKGLLFGDYVLKEMKAPQHYELDATPIQYTLDANSSGDNPVMKTITVENTAIPGAVELTKYAEKGEKLADAIFELQDGDGTVLSDGLVTNQEGKIFVGDLNPGIYQFVETKAPEGYELDATPIEFTIVKGSKSIVELLAFNKQKPIISKEEPPKKEEKNVPAVPTVPAEPITQKNPIQPSDGSKLPLTATNVFSLILIGFGLLTAGLIVSRIKRKKTI